MGILLGSSFPLSKLSWVVTSDGNILGEIGVSSNIGKKNRKISEIGNLLF